MKFWGIEIERKTDFLAFAAFILSVLTVFYQVFVHFVGPDAELVKPEGVTLMQFEPRDGVNYVSVLAPVSILNASNSPQPLVVRNIKTSLEYGNAFVTWEWHRRVEGVEAKTGKIDFDRAFTVGPFAIEAKKVNTNFYLFVPHARPCKDGENLNDCNQRNGFISIREFKDLIKSALRSNSYQASLDFEVEYEHHPSSKVNCDFEVDPPAFLRLRKNTYASFICE